MYTTSPQGAAVLPATGAALSWQHSVLLAVVLLVVGFALLAATGAAARLVPAGVRRGARDRRDALVSRFRR